MNRRMLSAAVIGVLSCGGFWMSMQQSPGAEAPIKTLRVAQTEDFDINGRGDAETWSKVAWTPLPSHAAGGHPYATQFKMLYSRTGLYVLMDGEDRRITATMGEDFLDLWNEDVFEFFLWPDERHPVYFEYEISPLGFELPILVPNFDGQHLGWRPWHYEGNRKIRKATTVFGGPRQSGATVTGWRAEVFVPYELLKPLRNVPPQPGTRWRANLYRVDYDETDNASWSWTPVNSSFHEFEKFGVLIFE
ncbi:MAG: carbohydrate-binding family 9-like protein [Solirubrobacterales bacterium]